MNTYQKPNFENIVELLIRLGVLFLLLMWCSDILSPFLIILVWGGIIAIAVYPVFSAMRKILRGKTVLTAILLTLIMLSVLVIPSWLVIESLFDGISYLRASYESGQALIPPPGESVANWPAFTQPFVRFWDDASKNIGQVMQDHTEQIKKIALWIFGAFSNFSQGLLQFVASIIIAGVLFVYSATIHASSKKIFVKLAGSYGESFSEISVATIRNVVKGILGVAVIQATMAGIGFFAAGIPFAGLWTILCLILAIIQIGAGPVVIPVIIYAYSTGSVLGATLLTIWLTLTLISDNVLKPILLGRNAPAPMLIIFLGAIGGFISHGFIGLFLGAVILTLAYKLFETWIDTASEDERVANNEANSNEHNVN